ncbi:ARO80 [[Candida] subhashii]|uniref:ARO80 n=1 Tax=[Candida] subhashii TaxID=561895 RepID=A0A8J5Q3Z2_9ASCO|nr:ARO80 [[Candida] subhashii]KAG7661319.1 ARO80 [[Candida] subhashii]
MSINPPGFGYNNNQQQQQHHSNTYPEYGSPEEQSSPNKSLQQAKFKRNYRACLNCRVRKVKCDLGPVDNPREGKCARCLRERKDCVFVESKRGGAGNVINGKRKKMKGDIEDHQESESPEASIPFITSTTGSSSFDTKPTIPNINNATPISGQQKQQQKLPSVNSILIHESNLTSPIAPLQSHHQQQQSALSPSVSLTSYATPPPPKLPIPTNLQGDTPNKLPSNHFSTMEGALVFLAKAAGTIAKADERDHIDARKKHEQIEAIRSASSSAMSSANSLNQQHQQQDESVSPEMNTEPTTATRPPSIRSRVGSVTSQATSVSQSHEQDQTDEGQHHQHHSHHRHHHHHNRHGESSIPPYVSPTTTKRMTIPAAEGAAVRPKASNKLSNIEYIGPAPHGILTDQEAERLINLFFTTMHPFFPHLPKFLHSSKVLAGYPILLCAILTISSRYHPFENNVSTSGNGSVPRNIEVHDRLWLYVQRLISQTVWAEASTRSIGTIFAFLLFTEWNPRAIHWRWSDYANKAEEGNEIEGGAGVGGGSSSAGFAFGANGSGNSSAGSDSEPNLAGLGAMRRSYRMAWMLIGSAVRLAQDMGFMEISSKTFLATHIAEINSVMDISRRSMLAHSLAEVDLDEDELTEEDVQEFEEMDEDAKIMKMTEEELKRISAQHILKFTKKQKAQIELLQIMSLGHESLYGYKAQLGSLSQRQNLSVLNIISPLINNWGHKYKYFLIPSNSRLVKQVSNLQSHWLKPDSKVSKEVAECIERESFIFEFNYVKLYIYSLALSPSPKALREQRKRKHGNITLKLDEMSRSAKYIEQAFNSANEMLNAAHRVHRLKMLRFMPVRWLTRMVRAVAFIVKCYLTITAHKNLSKSGGTSAQIDNYDSTILSLSLITIDDITQSIQRAAITLRDCSPDELHLCTRYSNVLMYLCSEMKTKKNNQYDEDAEVEDDAVGGGAVGDGGENQQYKRQKIAAAAPSTSLLTHAPKPVLQPTANTLPFPQSPLDPLGTGSGQRAPVSTRSMATNESILTNTELTYPMEQSPQQPMDAFAYGPSNYLGGGSGATAAASMSQSESMTPNDSNTPLQSLIGDSEVMDWFINNRTIGLDFVGPWTEMIEQQLNSNDQFNFEDAL